MKTLKTTDDTTIVGPFYLESNEAVLRLVNSEESNFSDPGELAAAITDFLIANVPYRTLYDVTEAVGGQLEDLQAASNDFDATYTRVHRHENEVTSANIFHDVLDVESDRFTTLPVMRFTYESGQADLRLINPYCGGGCCEAGRVDDSNWIDFSGQDIEPGAVDRADILVNDRVEVVIYKGGRQVGEYVIRD